MALLIEDAEVDRLAHRLSEIRNVSPTEAIRSALQNEIDRASIHDRIRPIQERIAALPKTGLKADKAFYDSLNDE